MIIIKIKTYLMEFEFNDSEMKTGNYAESEPTEKYFDRIKSLIEKVTLESLKIHTAKNI